MLETNKAQFFQKKPKNYQNQFLHIGNIFQNSQKSHQIFGLLFVIKICWHEFSKLAQIWSHWTLNACFSKSKKKMRHEKENSDEILTRRVLFNTWDASELKYFLRSAHSGEWRRLHFFNLKRWERHIDELYRRWWRKDKGIEVEKRGEKMNSVFLNVPIPDSFGLFSSFPNYTI